MNIQKKTFRSILAIYALTIAFLKIGLSLHSIRMAFRHLYLHAAPYSDIIIVVVLITAAVGVIKKAGWAGTLYILSMGMIMPELISAFFSMIVGSYYIYSVITIFLIILGVLFAFKVRSVVEN